MALDRIEAALNRIASGAPRAAAQAAGISDIDIPDIRSPNSGITDTSIIAERLDGLIARLRDALASVAD